jgi:photosystem II stability/assembly factor-like uncharacterized protein
MSKFLNIAIRSLLVFFVLPATHNAQWLSQEFPTNEWLMRIRFTDQEVGWILGFNYIYKTQDGGKTWVAQDSSMGYGEALYVLNDQKVIYSNYNGSFTNWHRGIRRTTDGGSNWETVDSLPFFYTDFEFINDQVGYAIGMDTSNINAIRMTTDSGATWNTVSSNFPQAGYELQGITFVNSQEGWVVSYDGYIYHTINGGMNWMLQDSLWEDGPWLPVRDIFFFNSDSGWAVGGISGRMLTAFTIDGGENWVKEIKSGNSLREAEFINNRVGWFTGVGYNPFIGKTMDGGLTWQEQDLNPELGPGSGFESISVINEQMVWVVGSNIYYTNNGGVSAVGSDDKKDRQSFHLKQNYPNPFNASTTINYYLLKKADVQLIIYDISGRYIDTILNKSQHSGNHSITLNAENLSSGIYIYKLKTNTFEQSRKMLLLK